MTITRKEFWDWMKTCPVEHHGDDGGWMLTKDMGDECHILFYFDIEETNSDEPRED